MMVYAEIVQRTFLILGFSILTKFFRFFLEISQLFQSDHFFIKFLYFLYMDSYKRFVHFSLFLITRI